MATVVTRGVVFPDGFCVGMLRLRIIGIVDWHWAWVGGDDCICFRYVVDVKLGRDA